MERGETGKRVERERAERERMEKEKVRKWRVWGEIDR